MEKGGFMFLLLLAALVALAVYQAMFPLPAAVVFSRFLGLAGFMLLCVALGLGPLAVISPVIFAQLVAQRRALGIAAFLFVMGHFAVTLALQMGWKIEWVLSQPALQMGGAGLAILLILALISNDWAVKNVPSWKNIQRFAYLAFVLSFAHFLLKANGLFKPVNGVVFFNLAEGVMVALGLAVVALQAAGALAVLKRKADASKQAEQIPTAGMANLERQQK